MSGSHPVEALSDDLEPTPFAVTVTPAANCIMVRVAGELDLSTAPVLTAIVSGLDAAMPGPMSIDLGELDFIDVAGSRALQHAATLQSASARHLQITGASGATLRLLQIVNLA